MSLNGTIVAAFGRHYLVRTTDGRTLTGHPRGKRSVFACGDEVSLGADGQLAEHHPRRSLLYRADRHRQKLIAANVTQLVLVTATEPSFSDLLLSRAIVAAECENLKVVIVLNKCDLSTRLGDARATLKIFADLGYPQLELVACKDSGPLASLLAGERSVLVGQSGMGKSTLVNRLVPDAAAATRETSVALDSGKHTTTHARLYRLPQGGELIDSPGLQEFGLARLDRGQIEFGFREFRPWLGRCRFNDCRHGGEPGCAIVAATRDGAITERRLAHFHQILSTCVAS